MRMFSNLRFVLLVVCLIIIMLAGAHPARAESGAQTVFKHIPMEYIVALGDPAANSGSNAQWWGLWHQDPGPRGCMLKDYEKLKASGGIAQAQWKYDDKDGAEHWELDRGAKLYDVTHQACHAARYTPDQKDDSCLPTMVQGTTFPVAPEVPMPSVKGCNKQEYAVLFVTGVAVENCGICRLSQRVISV